MNQPCAKSPLSYRLLQLAFAVALLALAGRVVQLAWLAPEPESIATPTAPGSAGGFIGTAPAMHAAAAPDAELAALYSHCPMAAVVDLTTVETSPEKVDALLPPYRPTADRVPAPPLDPAVPRIRYPVTLRPKAMNAPPHSDGIRIASLPKDAAPAAATTNNEWLIDPSEWYTPDEQTGPRKESDSAPDSAPPPAAPRAETAPKVPPIDQPPANKSWQLVTPDDLAEPADDSPLAAPELQLPPSPPEAAPSKPAASQPEPMPSAAPFGPPPPVKPFDAPPQHAPHEPKPPTPPPALPPPTPPTPPTEPTKPPEPAPAFEPLPPIAPQEETLPPAPHASDIFAPPPAPVSSGTAAPTVGSEKCVDPHLALFAKNTYPSARECAVCHEDIYHEWSISAHAYAAVSPMFHKFEQKLNDVSQGTVGYFCMRCHAPVATALCESRAEPLWNMPEVAREGITCIVCHRVQYVYGKSNGERRIEEGNIFAPVFGGIGGDGVAETIHRREHFKVKTSPEEKGPGQDMHVDGIFFEPLTKSEFCTPCHQVQVHPGIKLEVVWEQYRASPACKKGIQCQDCHMGRVPGLPLGYNIGPVAKIADKTVNDQRKRSNHVFYGPNYSIAHPGVFPFHLKANRWNMQEWLSFDWRAGWGTDEFEKQVDAGQIKPCFPPVWAEADDRYDAREIIDDNLKKLNHKRDLRVEVMENGSHVDGPYFDSPLCRGEDLHFHFIVTNTNEGHNLLTASLGAQPQLWANVVVIGPDGRRLWETGYTDSFGDVANIHSHDVRHKKVPYDWQLFNLQTMFLISGAKGTDREFFVPVNVDIDQLPFIRPGVQPISVINHPPFIRMESQSLAPLGARRVPYRVPGELLQQPGTYRLSFRMRSRAEPIYFMQFCGATEEMQRAMNEWMIDVHPTSVEFTIP